MNTKWQQPAQFPTLNNNDVHIWKIDSAKLSSNTNIQSFFALLAEKEQEHAHRLKIPKIQNNFLLSRGTLRLLLSAYLKQQPKDLLFTANQYGKLFITEPANIFFNTTHSHDLTLFAFSLQNQIGIDVELMRKNIDIEGIAARFFAKEEVIDLLNLPIEQRHQAFFNCWTRKEAFIKAIGQGLAYDLKKFNVNVSEMATQQVNLAIKDPTYAEQNWQLFTFEPKENYAGAFAVINTPSKIFFWDGSKYIIDN